MRRCKMIPHYMISIDSIPLAGTGKVNSKLLPTPQSSDLLSGAASSQPHQEHGRPKTHNMKHDVVAVPDDILPLARDIAAIFTEVLGCCCSIEDDFFFSGGHSILAARAVQMLRTRLKGGLAVPFTALLTHPTPAALAVRLADMRRWQDQADDLPAPLVLLRPSTTPVALSEKWEAHGKKHGIIMTDIVVMHPIGGGLMPMAGLVDALGMRLQGAARIIGLPWSSDSGSGSRKLATNAEDEEEEIFSLPLTVEAVAARYASILAEFISARRRTSHTSEGPPGGPLYLLGWSFGGTLAYETGKRIQSMMIDQGQEEANLQVILLDAPTLDAAVREIHPCALAAENYAEHFIDYIAERTRSRSANTLSSSRREQPLATKTSSTAQTQVQNLTQLLRDSKVDEYTDLAALSPLVRKCYENTRGLPSWITDADLVESARGLQANLQALCGSSYRQKRAEEIVKKNETTTVTVNERRKLGVVQVQASHGLGNLLPDSDLGWETELRLQRGRMNWTRHVVDTGHDDMLCAVDIVAGHIESVRLADG